MTGFILFSTHFPNLDDLKLILSVGINSIYFFGEVNEIDAVELINKLVEFHISLEILHLQ